MGSLHSLSRLTRGLTAATLCALASVGVLAAQSGGTNDDSVRSQLILGLRPVTLSFQSGLDANTAVNRALLRAPGGTAIRVQVGTLQAHPLMRIGTLDGSEARVEGDESARPRPRRYDLWLTRTETAWLLEAERPAADDGSTGPELVGTIPLSRRDAAEVAPTLSAALVPTGQDTGRLLLHWGGHRWTAGFDFAEPPENPGGGGGGGADGVRDFDSDTSAIARAVTLAERHETVMILPGGSRVSVLTWQELSPAHDDYAAVDSIRAGDVIRLTEAAPIRLRTEVSLRFGQLDRLDGQPRAGLPRVLRAMAEADRRRVEPRVQPRGRCLGHAVRCGLRRRRDCAAPRRGRIDNPSHWERDADPDDGRRPVGSSSTGVPTPGRPTST